MDVGSVPVQIAEEIRHLIDAYSKPVPSVLEIPSKDMPYDASKDSILKRAQVRICFRCVCRATTAVETHPRLLSPFALRWPTQKMFSNE